MGKEGAHPGGGSKVQVKHETLASQTRAEGEEYAIRMVEKKHTRAQVMRLMRLSYMENEITKEQKKEVEYR